MKRSTDINYSSQFFKADQRTSGLHKGYNQFNTFTKENKSVAGNIRFINDVFLNAGEYVKYNFEDTQQHLFIPVVGSIFQSDVGSLYEYNLIDSDEVSCISATDNKPFAIENAYEWATVNYIHVGLDSILPPQWKMKNAKIDFNSKNNLVEVDLPDVHLSFGVYDSRKKGTYCLKGNHTGVFIYIINGAIETAGGLMGHRDGLAIWNTGKIEFESLSDNSTIMLLEYKN